MAKFGSMGAQSHGEGRTITSGFTIWDLGDDRKRPCFSSEEKPLKSGVRMVTIACTEASRDFDKHTGKLYDNYSINKEEFGVYFDKLREEAHDSRKATPY